MHQAITLLRGRGRDSDDITAHYLWLERHHGFTAYYMRAIFTDKQIFNADCNDIYSLD